MHYIKVDILSLLKRYIAPFFFLKVTPVTSCFSKSACEQKSDNKTNVAVSPCYKESVYSCSAEEGKNIVRRQENTNTHFFASFIHVTVRSYLLPALLGITILILYSIYFGPIYLCDDGDTLNQLKMDLTLEVGRHRISTVNYEMYMDLKNQVLNTTTNNSDVNYLTNKVWQALGEMRDSLNNARTIETNIRRLEPSFRSPITTINYLRVFR
jgi:hypothetical protein